MKRNRPPMRRLDEMVRCEGDWRHADAPGTDLRSAAEARIGEFIDYGRPAGCTVRINGPAYAGLIRTWRAIDASRRTLFQGAYRLSDLKRGVITVWFPRDVGEGTEPGAEPPPRAGAGEPA